MTGAISVAKVKAQMGGNICCIGCVLKHVGVGEDFLKLLISNKCSILDINTSCILSDYVKSLDNLAKQKIDLCFQLALETNVFQNLHKRYYQKNEFKLCETLGSQIEVLTRGQILEIFTWGQDCEIAMNVIDSLKKQFMETLDHQRLFGNLRDVPFDRYMSVCFKSGRVEVGRPQETTKQVIKTRHGQWDAVSTNSRKKFVTTIFKNTERISMLIVQGLILPSNKYTSIQPWIKFLLTHLQNLDNILVVFLIDYCSYDVQEFINKTNVRRIANWHIDDSIRKKILWLDTSSPTNQDLRVPHDGLINTEKKINVGFKIRKFDDGCI